MHTSSLRSMVRQFIFCGSTMLAAGLPACQAQRAAVATSMATSSPTTTRSTQADTRLRANWLMQDALKVDGSGDQVSRPDFVVQGWHTAVVPGTVLTTLVADGTYADPMFGFNNAAIPESLNKTAWWYRTVLPQQSADGRKRWLKFEGINYTAEVWMNGLPLGVVRGAFTRGQFEITDQLRADRPNILAVLVHPQPNPGVPHQKTQNDGTGKNGGLTAVDGATFLSTIGWDWIPGIADRDTGIWQDVSIETSGPVRIENPFVQSKLPLPKIDSADLTVQATLRNATDAPQSGTIHGTIGEIAFEKPVKLAARASTTVTFTPAEAAALHIDQPKLWWPNGFGKQEMYSLHLDFKSDRGATSDQTDTPFGIRQVTYEMPGNDNLVIVVNGVPVFAKGGDWGIDEALKRIPPERLDAMVRLHAIANYTFIRNWVGQSTSEAFYNACDKYGILLWDEMFQPNPSDGPNPIDTEMYLANIKEKILRYRSHPCIALWCGRNEGDPPPEIHRGIQALIDQYDSSRLFQASSTDGRGVHSGGPYYWRVPSSYYRIDCAFKTEQGSMSIPTLEAAQAMLPQHSWNVIDDVWAEHDFCAGAQRGDAFPREIASRYGGFASLADFIRKGQMANYEAYRAMYEGRFAKLFRPTSGLFTWMSSPAQPSFVWQLYTHDLEPSAALSGTQKACEPLHIQMNQTDWHVMIVNNHPTTQPALTATARVFDLDGALKQTITKTLDAPGCAATDVGEIQWPKEASAVQLVRLDLKDAKGQPVGDNFYWHSADEMDFKALDQLPDAKVMIDARPEADGKLHATVKNTSSTFAVMTHLQLQDAATGQRVLPVFYSENYLNLLPGEAREVTIEAARPIVAAQVRLAVDGWNVVPDSSETTGNVGVVANQAARTRSLPASTRPAESEDAVRINCGGNRTSPAVFGKPISAPNIFDKDTATGGGSGGRVSSIHDDHPVSTEPGSTVPQSVYQSARQGAAMYDTLVKTDRPYTVILHFAEPEQDAGARKFNVTINGETVLQDLDIAAEAGRHHALVKQFHGVRANTNGHIVTALRRGSAGQPMICGIEVVPETLTPSPASATRPAATRAVQ